MMSCRRATFRLRALGLLSALLVLGLVPRPGETRALAQGNNAIRLFFSDKPDKVDSTKRDLSLSMRSVSRWLKIRAASIAAFSGAAWFSSAAIASAPRYSMPVSRTISRAKVVLPLPFAPPIT